MPAAPTRPTVQQHFKDRAPAVRAIYDAILTAAKTFGPVRQDPKKTSIHLVRQTAFAGIATRREALILTLKAAADISSDRILKRERASTNRWHLEVRLTAPTQVDRQLVTWLRQAYDLAG